MGLKRVRTTLDGLSLDLDGEERLPITASVGITFFPFHAGSVIELLTAANMAIGEAKAAGGNRVELADAWTAEPRAPYTTFDVLQGLVLAIDRKDRYTKLHSEDVACYAKLRHYPWEPRLAWTGHEGGHFGCYQPGYLRAFVLPLLTRRRG